jgi:hypothetical protein
MNYTVKQINELKDLPATEQSLEQFRLQWDEKSPIPDKFIKYALDTMLNEVRAVNNDIQELLKHESS